MKKTVSFLTTLLLVLMALLYAVGCSPDSESQSESNFSPATQYSVTFKQEGQNDVIKYVDAGKTLTDIPSPVSVDGYTVVWENKDLTNISSNIIVLAVKTANQYTITFDVKVQGVPAVADLTAVYAQEFTLPQLGTQYVGKHDCYDFLGWYKAGTNEKIESGTYIWASNLNLEAKWSYSYGTDQVI